MKIKPSNGIEITHPQYFSLQKYSGLSGIYTVSDGNKIYVGKSYDLYNRYKDHLTRTINRRYKHNKFYKYLMENDRDNFTFSVLVLEDDKEKLADLELSYITTHKMQWRGNCLNTDLNNSVTSRSMGVSNSKSVNLFEPFSGTLIKKFKSGKECAELLGYSRGNISMMISKKMLLDKFLMLSYDESPTQDKPRIVNCYCAIHGTLLGSYLNTVLASKATGVKRTTIQASLGRQNKGGESFYIFLYADTKNLISEVNEGMMYYNESKKS